MGWFHIGKCFTLHITQWQAVVSFRSYVELIWMIFVYLHIFIRTLQFSFSTEQVFSNTVTRLCIRSSDLINNWRIAPFHLCIFFFKVSSCPFIHFLNWIILICLFACFCCCWFCYWVVWVPRIFGYLTLIMCVAFMYFLLFPSLSFHCVGGFLYWTEAF